MNFKKTIFLLMVMVLFNACGEDSTSSSPTREESLENSEVTSEDSSQREELPIEEEETGTEITQEDISAREESFIEGKIWNVSNVSEFRQALEDASANGDHDTIVLDAGIYKTTSDGFGTFKFNDDEPFDLIIKSVDGVTYDDVILSGDNRTQVFSFNNTKNSILKVKGISIVDGNSSNNGGGIYSNHNIKIEDCNIYNNSSSADGGGFYSQNSAIITNSNIYNNYVHNIGGGFYSDSITRVTNSTISNNTSDGGGGFYSSSTTTVINSTISNNKANSGFGGGFYSYALTTVINSTISNNNSFYGGGFYSVNTTKVTNSTISNNSASKDGGGFYQNGDYWTISIITNSIISNNSASKNGGGFLSWNTTINNSTISNNSSYRGGGVFSPRKTIITNSKFSENNATYGGAMYDSNDDNYNSYISNNIFIENNSSIYAQGIFVNNIFKNNGDIDINLRGDSKLYNNYIDYKKIRENNNNVIKKHNLQPSSVGDIYLNSDNKTLSSNSPVIDKGLNPNSTTFKELFDNDEIYNQVVELLSTDIDGKPRVVNGTIDMGASERQ